MSKTAKRIIALAVADIHLSHLCPEAREAEPDWYAAMKRSLDQLTTVQIQYNVPVLCAGDIFDRWNARPELVNFALENLPANMIAVPGQHDLPWHDYEQLKKSGYYTLVLAGKIKTLRPGRLYDFGTFYVRGFPWEYPLEIDLTKRDKTKPTIALLHSYCWKEGRSYTKAPKDKYLSAYSTNSIGYDFLVFGDNHKGFRHIGNSLQVLNCGTFFRRNIDEQGYKPKIGVLFSDGSLSLYPLDVEDDLFIERTNTVTTIDPNIVEGIEAFAKSLNGDMETAFDFELVLKRHLVENEVPKATRRELFEIIEEARK